MKKQRSLYHKQALTGHAFCIPLYIGALFFFVLPLIQSIKYSFSQVTPDIGTMSTVNVGWENFHHIFRVDLHFTNNLIGSLTNLLYQVPFILIASLFLATIINQKFIGRTFVRAIFFLPVIVASGVVISLIQGDALSSTMMSGDEETTIFNSSVLQEFLNELGLNQKITEYFTIITNNIFDLLWKTGIQTLMFLAGLQGISPTLYEASAVEGATGWENFWLITFPMLIPIILVNTIYTIVDSFTDLSNGAMAQILGTTSNIEYGKAAAMGWSYTLMILVVLGIIFFLFKLPDIRKRRQSI